MADGKILSLVKGDAQSEETVTYEVGTWADVEKVAFSASEPVTVREICASAGRDTEGWDIEVDDEPATLDTVVKPGQRVLLIEDPEGN